MNNTYNERYAKMKDQMLAVMTDIAREVDGSVEEIQGDECGYMTSITRGDDQVLLTFTITEMDATLPGMQSDYKSSPVAGNFVFRGTDNSGETIVSWGPDNWTKECFAKWSDDDSWTVKIDQVNRQKSEIIGKLTNWQQANNLKP